MYSVHTLYFMRPPLLDLSILYALNKSIYKIFPKKVNGDDD